MHHPDFKVKLWEYGVSHSIGEPTIFQNVPISSVLVDGEKRRERIRNLS